MQTTESRIRDALGVVEPLEKAEALDQVLGLEATGEIGGRSFAEVYKTFNRALNRMQSKYLEFKDESERQARLLEEANAELHKLTLKNRAVTEFLNSILSSVSSAIVVVTRSGEISHINPAAERLFGISNYDALELKYNDLFREASGEPRADAELRESHTSRQSKSEKRLLLAGGRVGVFLAATAPLTDAAGEAFGSVEVLQDITTEREMERQIRRMEALAALGEMAASVAHQVRNPLVSVKGFASLIAADSGATESTKSQSQKILKGVDHLERVINALLRFSRREELTLKPTNLNRYLKKVVKQFNERIAISESSVGSDCPEVCFAPADEKIVADVDQLVFREVVQNILQNSHESTERIVQTNVTIERGSNISGTVVVTIADDGPGMSAETAKSIFRPFFTTKSSGSGLGLALAKKIVAAHAGALEVKSTLGRGAEFRITLPMLAGSSSADIE